MGKIIIVSNRLPVKVSKEKGGFRVSKSDGGLATGLASINTKHDVQWVGWPGYSTTKEAEQEQIKSSLDHNFWPVCLSPTEERNFYQGFSNETIWPLFHCFTDYVKYSEEYWNYYKSVNERFCAQLVQIAEEGDMVWVQDYHLMLLPALLKERLSNPIGFFLHIPFPSYELFRNLPWRTEILEGMLGADLIGFHTYEYMRHFCSSVYRLMGHDCHLGQIITSKGVTHIDSFPMGIDFDRFHEAHGDEEVIDSIRHFKKSFGNVRLILSVDRLDYTKGILNRLHAFDKFLLQCPEWREKVSFIMVTVPSRFDVEQYRKLKESVDELVGKINGKYSTLEWTPVHYFYRAVSFGHLTALYNICDVGLVTPLRDGMNLVAKEYVASKKEHKGVLILSEMAGASIELNEALRVNPHSESSIAAAINKALNMSEVEQQLHLKNMQKRIQANDIHAWVQRFTHQLLQRTGEVCQQGNLLEENCLNTLIKDLEQAKNPLLILDYDGTLVPYHVIPEEASPPEALLKLLKQVRQVIKSLIISGRDPSTLLSWLGETGVGLVAEHGMWVRRKDEWHLQKKSQDNDWMEEIKAIMEIFKEKTPGVLLEVKSMSIAFHYRKTDNFLAEMRIPQLINDLANPCSHHNLEILQGDKVLEVRCGDVNKGTAVLEHLIEQRPDFIMAIGDDKTDEDMFKVLPAKAYTVKVGAATTLAKYRLKNPGEVVRLLTTIKNIFIEQKSVGQTIEC